MNFTNFSTFQDTSNESLYELENILVFMGSLA